MNNLRLLRPLLYLKIKHQHKMFYDFYVPCIMSCLALFMCYVLQISIEINKLARETNIILGTLPGFYIAALAAIATFKNDSIDGRMDGIDSPQLFSSENGHLQSRPLTRRRFLCLLFGYLAFISIFMCILNILILVFSDAFSYIFLPQYSFLRVSFIFIYVFIFINMIVTTFLGLFYLADRIHWLNIPPSDEDE